LFYLDFWGIRKSLLWTWLILLAGVGTFYIISVLEDLNINASVQRPSKKNNRVYKISRKFQYG